MSRFFDRRDPWGHGLGLYVVLAMLFCLPPTLWSLRQIHVRNDTGIWIPQDDPQRKTLEWAHSQFPVDDQVYLTWNGSSLSDERVPRLVQRLAGEIDPEGVRRNGLKQVERVIQPRQVLEVMMANGIPFPEAMRRMQGTLVGSGPLKVQLTESAKHRLKRTQSELVRAAEKELGVKLMLEAPRADIVSAATLPALPKPTIETTSATDATSTGDEPLVPAILSPSGALLEGVSPEHDLQLSWQGMRMASPQTEEVVAWLKSWHAPGEIAEPAVKDCFFVPGSPIAIAVTLSEGGEADPAGTIQALRQAAHEVGIPVADLHIGGAAVLATTFHQAIMKTVWDSSQPWYVPHKRSLFLSSALAGMLMALFLLRSIPLAVIVLAASILAPFLATGLVPMTGGHMSVLLVLMPAIVMILTLSGGIHFANAWRHATSTHPSTALREAFRQSVAPSLLSSLALVLGFLSLLVSLLPPVRSLGFYSAVGVACSLGMILYGIPSLLQVWPPRSRPQDEPVNPFWQFLARMLSVRPSLKLTMCLAPAAVAVAGLSQLRTDSRLVRGFPEQSPLVKDYRYLEDHLAAIMPVEVVVRFDEAAQQQVSFMERMEAVRHVEEELRRQPEISGVLAMADFLPVSEKAPVGGSVLVNARYNKRSNAVQAQVREGEIPGSKAFYTVAVDARDLEVVGDQRLNHAGDELWRISAHASIMHDTRHASIVDDLHQVTQDVLKFYPGASHLVTGTGPLRERTQRVMLDNLAIAVAVVGNLMLAAMMLMLRNVGAGIVASIPVLLPPAMVAGVSGWMGQSFDLGTLLAVAVGLGVAAQNALHFAGSFQRETALGRTRREAVSASLALCGPAIWQTSFSLGAGMIVLSWADLLLIHHFGSLMAALVGVSLLSNLILLPLLLLAPTGLLFVPARTRRPQSTPLTDTLALSPPATPA